jgi:UDP-N-acetylglucosamine diphosphorylase/glucosamine-1-phosphate N-acetyltransferase
MNDARLILFDDARARAWEPFSLLRPISSLSFGALTLGGRISMALGLPVDAVLTDPAIAQQGQDGHPPVKGWGDGPGQHGTRVLISSRAAPTPTRGATLPPRATIRISGEVVGWILAPGDPAPREADLLNPEGHEGPEPILELPGTVLDWPWSLMIRNAPQLKADLPMLFPRVSEGRLPEGVHLLGTIPPSLGEGVEIEPGVVLDTRGGPIRLSDDVSVKAFTRLAGPAFVGSGTVLLGGDVASVTIGVGCKIRGEVADSVIGHHVNKAHEGHLGHSIVGDWVNLGAGTTNSDLKNNYAPIRVTLDGTQVATELLKVGCFLGDHVKTGIGTLIPTGAVLGAGSNVFGGGLGPAYLPPFSWAGPDGVSPYRLEEFIVAARRVMGRRGQELTEDEVEVMTRAWRGAHAG